MDWNIELRKWNHNVSYRSQQYKRLRGMEDKNRIEYKGYKGKIFIGFVHYYISNA